MNGILKLAKKYSKQYHLSLLPCEDSNNLLCNLNFLYDEKWENQNSYPYEILTYLFDSYYVLPQRPDLAALFCWQAINHSYYVQQLGDKHQPQRHRGLLQRPVTLRKQEIRQMQLYG